MDHRITGDAAHGCGKTYSYGYICCIESSVSAQASGKTLNINCESDAIVVTSTTYGGS